MRKKLAVWVGLVFLVLVVASFVVWYLPPAEPPLRVGMTDAEVSRVLGEPNGSVGYVHFGKPPYPRVQRSNYYTETGYVFGNRQTVEVYFDDEERVTTWEVKPLPRSRPPWLDTALKGIGW
jgi:uncharacterized protein (DUF58 family)